MQSLERQADLQTKAAVALSQALAGVDWSEARLNWYAAGDASSGDVDTTTEAGGAGWIRFPAAALAPLQELKSVMADPEKGTWLSLVLTLTPEGRFAYTFNYDRRFYLGGDDPFTPPALEVGPTAADWREEFTRYPREPAVVPEWAVPLLDAPSSNPADAAVLDRALATEVTLPAAYAGLTEQPGWADLWANIDASVVETLRSDEFAGRLAELQTDDSERLLDGLWQTVDAQVTGDLDQATAGTHLQLYRGLVAVGAAPAGDLEQVNPFVPIGESGSGGEQVQERVSEAIIALIRHQISVRLGR